MGSYVYTAQIRSILNRLILERPSIWVYFCSLCHPYIIFFLLFEYTPQAKWTEIAQEEKDDAF